MIKCVAVDDEPLALSVIKTYLQKIPSIELVQTFTDPFSAQSYLAKEKVDLIFMDIQMPQLDGILLYKSIPHPPAVIFTTAFSQYAIEGFNVDAIDYLLKPFDFNRFSKAVKKAEEYVSYKSASVGQFIFLRSEYQLVKIDLHQVLYFEALDDYIKVITTQSTRPILSLMSMKSLLEKLPAVDFIRVHRSYIVPIKKIEHVRNKKIKIKDKLIPVGESYSEAFFKIISDFQ